jgi:ribonuclease-3
MKKRRCFGLTFSNLKVLDGALTHPSYRNEHPHNHPLPDFDRLEFFGDAVLNYVICCALLRELPNADEGILSRFRSTLVSRRILARVAKQIKLSRFLKLSEGLKKEKESSKSKIMADAFEALLAAIYEDQGLSASETFILKHLGPYLSPRRLLRLDPNPKSMLQELSQKLWKKIPEYSWKITRQGIRVEVRVGKKHRTSVTGKNRKELEEKAARELLKKLRQKFKLKPRPFSATRCASSKPF